MGHSGKDMNERFQWTFPIVFSPHDPNTLYISSQHLFRTTRRGAELGTHQSRPDARRSRDARAAPADRSRSIRPASETVRDDLHDRAVAARRQRDLDGIGRRRGPRDARRRQELGEGDAAGSAGVHAHQHDRSVAAQAGDGVSRRQSLSAGRSRAVHLQDRRLRPELDEDRHRHSGRRFPARDSRGHRTRRPAVRRHRARHLHVVQRRRDRGSRCGSSFRSRRSTASSSRTTTW